MYESLKFILSDFDLRFPHDFSFSSKKVKFSFHRHILSRKFGGSYPTDPNVHVLTIQELDMEGSPKPAVFILHNLLSARVHSLPGEAATHPL